MGLVTITPPATGALALSVAKDHVYVEHTDHDALITGYIAAATASVEKFLDRALIKRTYRLDLDCFTNKLDLPKAPLIAVTSVAYDDKDGAAQTLAAAVYEVSATGAQPGILALAPDKAWPALDTKKSMDRVRITFAAGYGENETDIPEDIRQAIMYQVAHLFEFREPVLVGQKPAVVPLAYRYLLYPHKVRSF